MLAIDIGNSRIKWAVFVGDAIQCHGVFEYDSENIESALSRAGLPRTEENLEISCVAGNEIKKQFTKWLNENSYNDFRFAETQVEQCNVVNSYVAPSKMGIDRWLAMIAAFRLSAAKQDEMICVIDCGTAITLDVLNAEGRHQGGLIMPGYQTMVQSLISGTGNIRESEEIVYKASLETGLGNSTEEAVSKGCIQLVVGGLDGVISGYQKSSGGKLRCMVTGGDGEWVSNALDCSNAYNPYLVLHGLNFASTCTDN